MMLGNLDGYWIEEQRLYCGSHPSRIFDPRIRPALRDGISEILRCGFSCLVDLTTRLEHEVYGNMGYFYPDYDEQMLTSIAFGIGMKAELLRSPILDGSVPPLEEMKVLLDGIDIRLDLGFRIYLHCGSAIGRAPLVGGCYLKRHRKTYEEILRVFPSPHRTAHGHVKESIPDTEEQKAYIRDWWN